MGDPVVNSINLLLQGLKDLNVQPGEEFYTLWPVIQHCVLPSLAQETQRAFITCLLETDQNIIFQNDLKVWTSLSNCRILNPKLQKSAVGDIAYKYALNFYKEDGVYILKMPDWLLGEFKKADKKEWKCL